MLKARCTCERGSLLLPCQTFPSPIKLNDRFGGMVVQYDLHLYQQVHGIPVWLMMKMCLSILISQTKTLCHVRSINLTAIGIASGTCNKKVTWLTCCLTDCNSNCNSILLHSRLLSFLFFPPINGKDIIFISGLRASIFRNRMTVSKSSFKSS